MVLSERGFKLGRTTNAPISICFCTYSDFLLFAGFAGNVLYDNVVIAFPIHKYAVGFATTVDIHTCQRVLHVFCFR